MSNLLVRALTGIIAGSVSVALIVLSPWGLFAFCFLVSVIGLLEFYRITQVKAPAKWFMTGMAVVGWVWISVGNLVDYDAPLAARAFLFMELNWHVFSAILFAIGALITLFTYRGPSPITEVGHIMMGYVYVLLPFVLLFLSGLRTEAYDFSPPLGILFLTWALDVFAYFGGKLLGQHKLWERISPKKTWEGTIVGAVVTMGMAVAFDYVWPQAWSWIVIGGLVAVFSQLGDLVESMYKRGLQLKDSGGILPGHGGILDRFDGMLITLPMIYFYIYYSNF